MISKIHTAAVVGLDGKVVEVEVARSKGKAKFNIVGLPDKAVQEARDRVIAAVKNSGLKCPHRLTVNLAPADLPKTGPSYDLPIAVAVLAAAEYIPMPSSKILFVGELSLDGKLRHVNGILPVMDMAKKKGIKQIFVPEMSAYEASLIPGIEVMPCKSLLDILYHFTNVEGITPFKHPQKRESQHEDSAYDMTYVKGQEHAKRAMEIAAAGGHNLLMVGTPGSGKTLLARTMPTILPKTTLDESLEVTRIYSVAGLLPPETPLISQRPFRKPHHTVSQAALVGGGTIPKPGEISLAHRGVLFLDEFPEFSSQALEALRQPLEDKIVTISRAQGTLTFPANFMLVAAMNPCRCGWKGDPVKECTCAPSQVAKYQKRISGPILDRIDLQVNVPRVKYEKLTKDEKAETSESVRERVQKARDIQIKRFESSAIVCNAEIGQKDIDNFCKLDSECKKLLKAAVVKLKLSARAYFRIIRLARTIADLACEENIKPKHVAEALSYRLGETE